jgi:uncharacterized damage-inducible protein DinB
VQRHWSMNAPLAEMLRYNKWANLALFEACRALTDEQLDAQAPGASGSVRVLLTHIAGGQQTFVKRTQGRQHEGELSRSSPWPGFDMLLDVIARSSDKLIAIAEGLDTEREVDLPYLGKVYRFPVCFFLVHAMAHGVEHRTEIKLTLAQLGVQTPDLDGWPYSVTAGYGREV